MIGATDCDNGYLKFEIVQEWIRERDVNYNRVLEFDVTTYYHH